MKSGLSYWSGTQEELTSIQELCHQDHMDDISNQEYKTRTTAFARVFQPEGEQYYVMRIPSGIVKKKSLIDKMTAHNKNIVIVTSKQSWLKVEVN